MTTCVFVVTDQIMAVYEGFMEQHLLLTAARVPLGVGHEGYYQGLETMMQIGTSEYFQKQVSALLIQACLGVAAIV